MTGDDPTVSSVETTRAWPARAPATPPLTPASGRFAPGAIIAGRYRLVALLGKGGMGEVYRADDLTLDQPVALKFLPADVAASEDRLSRFHNELRVARRVSHKNVCRLYDLGEADGRRFLTMEYVDGEDLASLLRRVGRVPQDRAVQMSRQLCAGIAAAHERGVIHRDLKPANVMIDGEGHVRITDFGIATAAGQTDDVVLGTPQYMAPEQLTGHTASLKSDLYALGLILFELFTGRRAIESRTLADLQAFHRAGTLTTPTSIVPDLDPAVERVILRCLDRDPARRPASALAVAAALPGGDPLAAALAAGETPSPEILAAAGETEALGVVHGLTLVALTIVGLLAFAAFSARLSIASRVPFGPAPAVLNDRAEQIIASFGYPRTSDDHAGAFIGADDYLRWLRQTRPDAHRWDAVAHASPPAVLYWYRTSPRVLTPQVEPSVSVDDPPVTETDMRVVVLDPQGRLQEFRSVPPQHDTAIEPSSVVPWPRAFEAAGLEMSAFTPVPPEWTPRDFADTRAAWQGQLPAARPGAEAIPIRVEASAYRGKLVSFAIIGPWTRPSLMQPRQRSPVDQVIVGVATIFVCVVLVVAAVLARRHLRSARADRRGATRLAFGMAFVGVLFWVFGAHHVWTIEDEFESFVRKGSEIAFVTLVTWTMYLALEPYVRRLWPDSLLGWSRLLAGHIRDPRVGRDVLVGCLAGVLVSLIAVARDGLIPWLGYAAPSPMLGSDISVLTGPGTLASKWMLSLFSATEFALLTVLVVVLVRLASSRTWISVPITVLIVSMGSLENAGTTNAPFLFVLLFVIASGALFTWVVFRWGLLALAVAMLVNIETTAIPMMPTMTHWSATAGNWTLAALVALVGFGFYASRTGQPLFGPMPEQSGGHST